MRDDRARLVHILDSIEKIERYARRGREEFDREELIPNWMLRHLQIIGEASSAISKEFREHRSEVPWSSILGTRHRLMHDYARINMDIVWSTIEHSLPPLKTQILAIPGQAGGSL